MISIHENPSVPVASGLGLVTFNQYEVAVPEAGYGWTLNNGGIMFQWHSP